MYDCLIIGGGVVGLSIAWQAASAGLRVMVVERGALGREASWAGAGILPPANRVLAAHPLDQLRGLSAELHAAWAEQLRELTGIDTGYRKCGGLYVAGSLGESAALRGMMSAAEEEGVRAERLTADEAVHLEPQLAEALASGRIRAAYFLPDEAQLRNPWHLVALAEACRRAGVNLLTDTEVLAIEREGQQLTSVHTATDRLIAGQVCVCAGAWTQRLLGPLQVVTGILPIRGQMLQFYCPRPPLDRIINEGNRYIVPRPDGYVLVGSTEEEAGFVKQTTEAGLCELKEFGQALVPALRTATLQRTWAGLRPGTLDGFPYLGRLPGTQNGFVASGHFRSGLYLSPATARVMTQLLLGQAPEIDISPFSVLRG